jgi:monofunctional biosynthetic peptidoglycan transglycosylase
VAWRWVDYARISPHLKRAVLVAEDTKFFSHGGFDTTEIGQALREAVEAGERPRGASTITQQLAKNLWLSSSLNPVRKVKEAILTWQLERTLSKRRILELYLNVVEFGPGVHGAEAASRHYFGKAARALSENEAVELAATLPKPSAWHPGATSRAYRRYVKIIKRRLAGAHFLWRQI